MSLLEIEGIVTKEVQVGESDKIVTIFSDKLGKISASAKGARKTNSSIGVGTQLFSYCKYQLFKGKNNYIINSCEMKYSFYGIRNDMNTLIYAVHITEMINDTIQENVSSKNIFKLYLKTLYYLTKPDKNKRLIISIFELKLISYLGYAPVVDRCVLCKKNDFQDIYFSFKDYGFVCEHCISDINKNYVLMGHATVKTFVYVLYGESDKIFAFTLDDKSTEEFSNIIDKYINIKLEKEYNKLNFIIKE